MASRNCGYVPMDDLGCAVNDLLSWHGFRFLLIFFRSLLGYLKDCNVAAPSVDSDIFYVSHQSICGFQVWHYNLYFLKQCQIVLCKLKSVLVCINFMHHDASMAKCDNVTGPAITNNPITIKPQAEETEVRSALFSCVNTHTVRVTSKMLYTGGSPKISPYFVQIA